MQHTINMNKVSEVSQSCVTLCDPMDCSLPGSSTHGILQARVLEWVAISFSRGSSQSRDWTWVSHIARRCYTIWATREALFQHEIFDIKFYSSQFFISSVHGVLCFWFQNVTHFCLLLCILASTTFILVPDPSSHQSSTRTSAFSYASCPSLSEWPFFVECFHHNSITYWFKYKPHGTGFNVPHKMFS